MTCYLSTKLWQKGNNHPCSCWCWMLVYTQSWEIVRAHFKVCALVFVISCFLNIRVWSKSCERKCQIIVKYRLYFSQPIPPICYLNLIYSVLYFLNSHSTGAGVCSENWKQQFACCMLLKLTLNFDSYSIQNWISVAFSHDLEIWLVCITEQIPDI